jgi:UDP-N-acetylmuramoylalanine--D-glutamate ligase
MTLDLPSRVLIIGAARQGTALARYLVEHGARVILNDARTAGQLHSAREALADLPIQWALGGPPLSLLEGVDWSALRAVYPWICR